MSRICLAALFGCCLVLAASPPAQAARGCGLTTRPYTDARVLVTVLKGNLRCRTAKRVLRTYWRSEVTAFEQTRRIRVGGIRWTCRPTSGDSLPKGWTCAGGGQGGTRFRLAARE